MLFTVDIMPAGVSGILVMGGHSVHYVRPERLGALCFHSGLRSSNSLEKF